MPQIKSTYYPTLKSIEKAAKNLEGISQLTPLQKNLQYSKKYNCNVFFKREDLQLVRSYKIRGAYNKMSSLSDVEAQNGIVCASAGNHAQGVALSCKILKINGVIFMPAPTPNQKIEQVKFFGENFIEFLLDGDT